LFAKTLLVRAWQEFFVCYHPREFGVIVIFIQKYKVKKKTDAKLRSFDFACFLAASMTPWRINHGGNAFLLQLFL